MRGPLVIGVTGHRDLRPQDVPCLEEAVFRFLRAFVLQGPVCMLNSLAEGADQLCARVALRMGIPVRAVLPMPAERYVQTFLRPRDTEGFWGLLDGCVGTVTVCGDGGGAPEEAGRAFRGAGWYVAGHCDVLLALWDGVERVFASGGGTYETVLFAKERGGVEVWRMGVCRVSAGCAEGGSAGGVERVF